MSVNQSRSPMEGRTCARDEAPAPVHKLFELQARRAPRATALAFKDWSLTYAELDERAEGLAGQLIELGVGPESLVAICAERSLEQAMAMLAVLKAGGAYVPLDPAYPNDRLSAILEEARPVALLTRRTLLPRLASFAGSVVFIDEKARAAKPTRHPAPTVVGGDNLAYAIFTSGSTGKPKGVLIEHRSLANHALTMARYFELTQDDRVLQFASFSFDVAAEEIYPTWSSGAQVVLWPVASGVAPVRNFVEFVETNGITVLNLPAAYWHEWVAELGRVGIPPSVRLVVTGSDKVSTEKFARWQKYAGTRVRFCAAYGPTEATITATVFDPPPGFASSADCMPIGKPIANARVYVLDPALKEVADGETGELHIGGIGLARGYLGQPELTAEKFVRDPFGEKEEGRLYKTGDLARRLADGNLEFLGRIDDQVKIRGFRIETGEIENVLKAHPAAHAVVVVGREAGSGEKQLVAYVVVSNDNRPSVEDLRQFVKGRLPDYMVPSAFVMLKSLPLTPGGKVDRRQLPPPDIERDSPDKEYVAPRSDMERRLVEIWEKMLDVRPVGIRDNFFDLGGHSLMEARLVAEVERRLGVTLPLATIYYTRTIESLARTLEQKKSATTPSLVQPYRIEGTKPAIFSHGGSTHLADYLGEDQPIYWLEHHGTSGYSVPDTIEEMAANYVHEIRRIQPCGPYYLLGYCIGGVLMLEAARQLLAQNETIGLLSLIDPITPQNMPRFHQPAVQTNQQSASGAPSAYLTRLKRVLGKFPRRYRWLKRISKRTFCDLWIRSGQRLPVYWRDFYCDEKLNQALERYAPSRYPGSFVIFRQPNNGTEAGWRALAAGTVDFEDTWIDHNLILEEPYVQILAGKLQACLREAQREKAPAREVLIPTKHGSIKEPGASRAAKSVPRSPSYSPS